VRAADRHPDRGSLGAAGLVLAGAALFGTVGTAQLLGPEVPVSGLAAARLLLAGLVLSAMALAAGRAISMRGCLRHAPTWWAALGQIGFNLCFLGAMIHAGVAVGTLVAIGATPILTGLVTRQVSLRWLAATGIAVAGLALLVGGQLLDDGAGGARPLSPLGIVLAVGAAASYATYIISGNVAASRGLDTSAFLAVAFSGSAVLGLPLLAVTDVSWLGTPDGLLLVGYLAVVPTVLAYHLFNRGLGGVRSSTASTLALIEPVIAAGLAVLVLGERLSVVSLLGAGLILVGLLVIVRASAQSNGR
jgi:DME family drug/metabolite transporter